MQHSSINIFRYLYCIVLCFLFIFYLSCSKKSPTDPKPPEEKEPELELISSVSIQVDEPSGLCFSIDKNNLWTVSDKNLILMVL